MIRPIEVKRLMNNWLITGGAGFIGQNLTEKLLSSEEGFNIVIIDNLKQLEIYDQRILVDKI